MEINCLSTQVEFFETRFVKRTFEPVFLDINDVPKGLTGPLVLFGQWYPQGFTNGIHWLATYAFQCKHPCILLPPFEIGSIGELLGLTSRLIIKSVNTNRLSILPDAKQAGLNEIPTLQIQTDYVFIGPTGTGWLKTEDQTNFALLSIQPKNTSTPLLLCGSRLLNASGLSNDADRLRLLEAIGNWAINWKPLPTPGPLTIPDKKQVNEEVFHVVCIVLAGCRLKDLGDVNALSTSIFGIEIDQEEMEMVANRMVELGLGTETRGNLNLNSEKLDEYAQNNELWAYVRALRKDFKGMRL